MNKTPPSNIDQLRRLANKLQENHEFFAWALSKYQIKEHIDDEQLIAHLNTSQSMLVRLALCKYPDPNSSSFAAHIRKIAKYTNIDPIDLANIIRQVDALETLAKIPNRYKESTETTKRLAPGLLAATRDRIDAEDDETKKSDSESNGKSG